MSRRQTDPSLRDAVRRLDREHALVQALRRVAGEGVTVLRVASDTWLVREHQRGATVRVLQSDGWRSDPAIAPDAFVHPRGGVLQVGVAPGIAGLSATRRRKLATRLWEGAVPEEGWLVSGRAATADAADAARRAAAAGGLVGAFREEQKLHAEGYGWFGRPATHVSFAGREFIVPRGVYPPKRVTEGIVRRCLDRIAATEHPFVVDVGTGAGILAVAVALARPDARVVAVDRSPRAVGAARRNARAHGVSVDVLRGDLLAPVSASVDGRVDAICANVPYVAPCLAADPGFGAPRGAVAGADPDGLGLVRRLAVTAKDLLVREGHLVFQIADTQWDTIRDDLAALGYRPEDPDVRKPGFAIVASARMEEGS